MHCDTLIINATPLITCASSSAKRTKAMTELGIIENGAVAISNHTIAAVGTTDELSRQFKPSARTRIIDAKNRAVIPGFVEPHTHLVFCGSRVDEFEQRIAGYSYLKIMEMGGGIVSSMRATRSATIEQLIRTALPRLDTLLKSGTTTVEIKSGYGLSPDSELRMLQAMEQLDALQPVDIIPTFLGAHAIPPEYKHTPDSYVDTVVNTMIPQASVWYNGSSFKRKNIPFFNDVFCEKNAFTCNQSRMVLERGKEYGLIPKVHADEFTSIGGVSLAVDMQAVSVDHCDVTTPQDRRKLAHASTVAVVLPAVTFNLAQTGYADARAMIDEGVAVALSTDYNPGSAPCISSQFVLALACRYQKLLPAEALNACTINAAFAIGMGHAVGSIQQGKQADMAILKTSDYRDIVYEFGSNGVETVIKKGEVI